MTPRPSLRLATMLIGGVLVVVACGGATSSTGADGSPAAASPDISLPSDVVLPSDLALPSDIAIPSFDLGSLIQNLENVDSYRSVISVGDGDTYTGTVILRPVLMRDLYIGTGDDATHIVTIGDEIWMGEGDGEMQPAPAAMVGAFLPLFDPMVLLAAFANEGITQYADNLGEEEKNGQPTTHYRVDGSKITGGLASFPPGAVIEMWISDEGYLVSFAATGFGADGSDLTVDVTNVNDPANVVERPS